MNSCLKGNKGYTLIELMMTVTVFSVLLTVITSVFLSGLNLCNALDRGIELQQQGLFILSFIEEKIIESEGILYIEDVDGNMKQHSFNNIKIKKIVFKNHDNHRDIGYIFNLTKNIESKSNNLLYGIGLTGYGSVELGNYIDSIEIEPLPEGASFIDSRGITIKINFAFDSTKTSLEDTFCFRNKTGRL